MTRQSIIHRMLMEEIIGFKKLGIKPNKIVMSTNTLRHMERWKEFPNYFIPAWESEDLRQRYYGLVLVESVHQPDPNSWNTAQCFVCCAASYGKVNGVIL